jgi:glutamate 5-kinase
MKEDSGGARQIDPVRQEVLALTRTLVVKVGTNVLTTAEGTLDRRRVAGLAEQVDRIRQTGRKVVLVSSGAIGAGVGRLELGKRPADLRHLQAAAAVGQTALMGVYEECFTTFGCHVAQILLTASDFDNRTRYLNARNTIVTLFEWDCIPIINENDTVSVAEIRFGDNDQLAAMVTNLLQADLLILLTTVDGLYAGDPRTDPSVPLVRTVPVIDEAITRMAGESRSPLGTGGMRSKLAAARLVTTAGESVIMANGAPHVLPAPPTGRGASWGILDAIMSGEPVGTLFLPHGGILKARQRWIGLTAKPAGRYVVDAGARKAVQEKGRSLLPIGVVEVSGAFDKGDIVALVDSAGVEFARGLSNYSAADAGRVKGLRSDQVIAVLGAGAYEEMIHRDNLVVTDL